MSVGASSKPTGSDAEPVPIKRNPSLLNAQAYPIAVPLRGVVQNYAWGKCHQTSLVAAMATEQVRSNRGPVRAPPLSRGNRFAELWMGTHPNGHSSVVLPGMGPASGEDATPEEHYLKDVIEADPEYWLGIEDAGRKDLPYLFKVLAVGQALSIQAHPNKSLAEKLHKQQPSNYPDGNHKPEICIPLGHFEALAGFRPVDEVLRFVDEVPELQELCSSSFVGSGSSSSSSRHCDTIMEDDEEEEDGKGQKAAKPANVLRKLYTNLMRQDKIHVQHQVKALVQRLKNKDERSPEEELILRTEKDYPGDIGIFSIYFLNYVRITPDMPRKYIYCAPDEPHAYLLGDAVECMAISDNVVRAGLTLKHKDVDTLLSMMSYRDDLLAELVCEAEQVGPHVLKYDPPVDDFIVYEITGPVPEGLELPRAAIVACVKGSFHVEFRPAKGHLGGHEFVDAAQAARHVLHEGPQDVKVGHTFFSCAGAALVVLDAEPEGRLFIATY